MGTFRKQTTRHFSATLALLALLGWIVMPAVGLTAAPGSFLEICTAQGIDYLSIRGESSQPSLSGHNCPLCSLEKFISFPAPGDGSLIGLLTPPRHLAFQKSDVFFVTYTGLYTTPPARAPPQTV